MYLTIINILIVFVLNVLSFKSIHTTSVLGEWPSSVSLLEVFYFSSPREFSFWATCCLHCKAPETNFKCVISGYINQIWFFCCFPLKTPGRKRRQKKEPKEERNAMPLFWNSSWIKDKKSFQRKQSTQPLCCRPLFRPGVHREPCVVVRLSLLPVLQRGPEGLLSA